MKMKNQEEFIFRYRPTKSFNEHKELEKQEIYFGALGELNDPMEGYKNIFWKGDKILWFNLLKRYIGCLQKLYIIYCCTEEKDKYDFKKYKYLAYLSDQDFKTESFNKICKIFFAIPSVEKLLTLLELQENMVREGLIFYLELLHRELFDIIQIITLGNHEITPDMLNKITSKVTKLNEHLSCKLSEEYKKVFKKIPIEKFHKSAKDIFSAFTIINAERITTITERQKYNKHLLIEFPKHYVYSLEELMYPEPYIASFTKDCTNSSMWSNYAEKHRGICLKFKTTVFNNQLCIPNIGKLEEVEYIKGYPEIDFFRSLGRQTMSELKQQWYTDGNGNTSAVYHECFGKNEDNWRKNYWKKYRDSLFVKFEEWKYEEEYRIIISALLEQSIDAEKRLFRYEFENLDGIIFGAMTSEEDILKIAKIIQANSKVAQRDYKSFNFYQAYYDNFNKKIKIQKLRTDW
jgi:hypothetical protein